MKRFPLAFVTSLGLAPLLAAYSVADPVTLSPETVTVTATLPQIPLETVPIPDQLEAPTVNFEDVVDNTGQQPTHNPTSTATSDKDTDDQPAEQTDEAGGSPAALGSLKPSLGNAYAGDLESGSDQGTDQASNQQADDGAADAPALGSDIGPAFTEVEADSSGSGSGATVAQVAASRAGAMINGRSFRGFRIDPDVPVLQGVSTAKMDQAGVDGLKALLPNGQKAQTTAVPIPQPADSSPGL